MKIKKQKKSPNVAADKKVSSGRIPRGVFVRVFFGVHSLLYTWRVVSVKDNNYLYWGLMGVQLLMLIEATITLKVSKTGEWHWFTPCIFLYLCNVVPCVWLVEFDLLEERLSFIRAANLTSCTPPETNESAWLTFYDVTIPVELNDESWALALQQILLFFLIVGRWILPRGYLSHEKLSNLLLINIGMAADIVEFLAEGIQAEAVKCNQEVILIVLCIWTVSILQFPFQWDTNALRRISIVSTLTRGNGLIRLNWLDRCFRSTEVWAILSIILMQDGPFLAMRLYLISLYGISDQSLVFFSAKNVLVLMLQFYRLWALLCLEWDEEEGRYSLKLSRKIRSLRRTVRNFGGRAARRNRGSSREEREESAEGGENQFRVVESGVSDGIRDGDSIGKGHRNASFTAENEDGENQFQVVESGVSDGISDGDSIGEDHRNVSFTAENEDGENQFQVVESGVADEMLDKDSAAGSHRSASLTAENENV